MKLPQKENFKPEIEPMIENWQGELYQLEKKCANGAKLCANIRWELACKKYRKTFLKVFERHNLQNQIIFELYPNDNKSKYSSNPEDIFKCAKKVYEKLCNKETTSKAATTKFLSKISNRKKKSIEQFNLWEAKICLYEIKKSINSQTNNKSSGNDALTAEFYRHFSNHLAHFLLDV